MVILRILPNT